jgi:5-formyltetrahydrofolate cyclo-ligase
MFNNPKEQKNALRAEYKQIRAEMSEAERRLRDEKICAAIISLASYRFAKTVLMYAPTGNEIDVSRVALHAIKSGKRIAYPLCNVEEHSMVFKEVASPSELTAGSYSIPEPPEDAETVADLSDSICLVPGLVFDKEGFRVGYGKGYYDRFLSTYKYTKLGIVYSDFILDTVPRGRFDRRTDILVTERGIRFVEQRKTK